MSEMEVFILDDQLDDDPWNTACLKVKKYALGFDGVTKVREARSLSDFKKRITEFNSEDSHAFIVAFIDYSGPDDTEMAIPALKALQAEIDEERFMTVLMSNLRSPQEDKYAEDVFGEWVAQGGQDYIAKTSITDVNLGTHYLTNSFMTARKMMRLWAQKEKLLENENRQREKEKAQSQMVGDSSSMREIHDLISKVAPTDGNVLISGESGTGKELVARAIHHHGLSTRKDKPFVAVNCAAIPEDLLESELFGHEKGAFTGAVALKKGVFELADGGSLFLDEIGELEFGLQAKLNRVLQERTVRRVGGEKDIHFDVRIISATLRDLDAERLTQRFRADLYWRLSVLPIVLPPLRDRKEDVPALTDHFLREFSKGRKTISQAAMDLLTRYDWPGNVRELRNSIERATILSEGNLIDVKDLAWLPKTRSFRPVAENDWLELRAKIASRHPDGKCELVDKRVRDRIPLSEEETARAKNGNFDVVMNEVYQGLLVEVLNETGGDIGTIKKLLGDRSEKTIKNALSDYGIEVEKIGGRFVAKKSRADHVEI